MKLSESGTEAGYQNLERKPGYEANLCYKWPKLHQCVSQWLINVYKQPGFDFV